MRKLFRIEMQKLMPYTTFWALLAIHLFLFIIVVLFANSFEIKFPGFEIPDLYAFPLVWNVIPWLASWFNLFLTVIIIAFVGNEFVFKTFRQHLIDGLSRIDLVKGKLIVIAVIGFYGFVLVFLTSVILGFLSTDNIEFAVFSEKSYFLLVYYVQAVAYMCFGLMVVLLVRNIALAIVSFVLYYFPFEPMLRFVFPEEITRFFPMKVISNLTPSPDFPMVETNTQFHGSFNGQQMTFNQDIVPDLPLYANVFVAMGYIALFAGISILIVRRRNF